MYIPSSSLLPLVLILFLILFNYVVAVISVPLTMQNETIQIPFGYQLPSDLTPTIRHTNHTHQQYSIVISLKVPYPYAAPTITIPIQLLPDLQNK